MNTVPYRPLKDLVNTYLPGTSLPPPKEVGKFPVVKCQVCHQPFEQKPPGETICPACQLKDKYL